MALRQSLMMRSVGRNSRSVERDSSAAMAALVFELAEIGARCREVGAALVVDGTQSVGAMPFDWDAIQPDALVCAGYKWLLGGYGMGVMVLGDRFADGQPLEENWIGRAGSDNFSGLTSYEDAYAPGAVRFDVGERSNPILVPMLAAGIDERIRRDILGHALGRERYGKGASIEMAADLLRPIAF